MEPMRQVHSRFTGEKGTLAQFGDSITVTLAFWTPMLYQTPRNMDESTAADYALVKNNLQEECWRQWKGAEFGNASGMTIRWAHENIDGWLRRLNPEAALIMFGTNDLGPFSVNEYEQWTREVVRKCLANGTVVILSTIPPRHGQLQKATEFAEAVRRVGRDLNVPVCDYMAAILKRRPDDWNGTMARFRPREGYDVLTLIAGDGVHPSNPKEFRDDFSEKALSTSGYSLRNYLVLRDYANMIRFALDSKNVPSNGE